VIVCHDKFNAVKTASLELQQKISPARSALAIGKLYREYLAPAIPKGGAGH
jgi:hypothetical protein